MAVKLIWYFSIFYCLLIPSVLRLVWMVIQELVYCFNLNPFWSVYSSIMIGTNRQLQKFEVQQNQVESKNLACFHWWTLSCGNLPEKKLTCSSLSRKVRKMFRISFFYDCCSNLYNTSSCHSNCCFVLESIQLLCSCHLSNTWKLNSRYVCT